MITRVTSTRALTAFRVRELVNNLPGVRDGLAESVHLARVASRRLRELLPMAAARDADQMREALDLLRQAGRRLGRVRELDVMRAMLEQQERRVPTAGASIAQARGALALEQQLARRKLIKALERLELDAIGSRLPPLDRRTDAARIAHRVGGSAAAVRDAVEHAGGVYFPQRVHAVRIAAKKLRYAVEVAHDVGLWQPPRLLKDLGRIQDNLGELHDDQELLDRLAGLAGPAHPDQRQLLEGLLRAEIERLHERFLARRERLLLIVDACGRFASRRTRSGWRLLAPAQLADVALLDR